MKFNTKTLTTTFLLITTLFLIGWGAVNYLPRSQQKDKAHFNGQKALEDVAYQVNLGPRTPGSAAHKQTIAWIQSELQQAGWSPDIQKTVYAGQPVINIIGKRASQKLEDKPWIIIGAHYDSRLFADQDPDSEKRASPVPGANDGASGVALLLEMARVLPKDLSKRVWIVFFDSEDNGRIQGWDWILGSRAFVDTLDGNPDSVVIVDMIGDADLNIYQEQNSSPALSKEIWDIANELGYSDRFIPSPNHRILDDHIPFLGAGFPAVDIIDFDYPYWHTSQDTVDKISAQSLQVVGDTLLAWLTR